MEKKILFVDICNTLANVNAELEREGIRTNQYPASIIEKEINWESIFRNAEPIEPVITIVQDFSVCFRVIYLTARDNKMLPITMNWLKENGLPQGPVLHTRGREKGKFVAYHGDRVAGIFEDNPKEIESVQQVNPSLPVYIPDWEYNQHVTGRRIELRKSPIMDKLQNLKSAIHDLSYHWSLADEEVHQMLEREYPFDQSFDELAGMMNHWVGSLLAAKRKS